MAHPRSAVDLTGELVAHPPEDLDKFFQAVLTQCPQLQSLDLAANGLGDSGVASLMGAMRHPDMCKHLAFLGLARNDICDAGGRRIATWLALSSRPLERLELRDNSLGDAAASAFAAVLAANRSLHHLSLLHNSIGHAGAQSLALALRHNQTLVTLDLRLNLIAPGELHAMLGGECANGDASAATLLPNEHGETVADASHVVDPSDCETRAAPAVHPREGWQQATPVVDPLERGRQVALSPCQRGQEGGSAPIESETACRKRTEVEVAAAGQRLLVRGRPSLDMLLATDSESEHQDDIPRVQSVSDAPSSMDPLRTCHATDEEEATLSGQVKPFPLSNTAAIAMRLGLSVPPGFVQQWQQQMSVRAERSHADGMVQSENDTDQRSVGGAHQCYEGSTEPCVLRSQTSSVLPQHSSSRCASIREVSPARSSSSGAELLSSPRQSGDPNEAAEMVHSSHAVRETTPAPSAPVSPVAPYSPFSSCQAHHSPPQLAAAGPEVPCVSAPPSLDRSQPNSPAHRPSCAMEGAHAPKQRQAGFSALDASDNQSSLGTHTQSPTQRQSVLGAPPVEPHSPKQRQSSIRAPPLGSGVQSPKQRPSSISGPRLGSEPQSPFQSQSHFGAPPLGSEMYSPKQRQSSFSLPPHDSGVRLLRAGIPVPTATWSPLPKHTPSPCLIPTCTAASQHSSSDAIFYDELASRGDAGHSRGYASDISSVSSCPSSRLPSRRESYCECPRVSNSSPARRENIDRVMPPDGARQTERPHPSSREMSRSRSIFRGQDEQADSVASMLAPNYNACEIDNAAARRQHIALMQVEMESRCMSDDVIVDMHDFSRLEPLPPPFLDGASLSLAAPRLSAFPEEPATREPLQIVSCGTCNESERLTRSVEVNWGRPQQLEPSGERQKPCRPRRAREQGSTLELSSAITSDNHQRTVSRWPCPACAGGPPASTAGSRAPPPHLMPQPTTSAMAVYRASAVPRENHGHAACLSVPSQLRAPPPRPKCSCHHRAEAHTNPGASCELTKSDVCSVAPAAIFEQPPCRQPDQQAVELHSLAFPRAPPPAATLVSSASAPLMQEEQRLHPRSLELCDVADQGAVSSSSQADFVDPGSKQDDVLEPMPTSSSCGLDGASAVACFVDLLVDLQASVESTMPDAYHRRAPTGVEGRSKASLAVETDAELEDARAYDGIISQLELETQSVQLSEVEQTLEATAELLSKLPMAGPASPCLHLPEAVQSQLMLVSAALGNLQLSASTQQLEMLNYQNEVARASARVDLGEEALRIEAAARAEAEAGLEEQRRSAEHAKNEIEHLNREAAERNNEINELHAALSALAREAETSRDEAEHRCYLLEQACVHSVYQASAMHLEALVKAEVTLQDLHDEVAGLYRRLLPSAWSQHTTDSRSEGRHRIYSPSRPIASMVRSIDMQTASGEIRKMVDIQAARCAELSCSSWRWLELLATGLQQQADGRFDGRVLSIDLRDAEAQLVVCKRVNSERAAEIANLAEVLREEREKNQRQERAEQQKLSRERSLKRAENRLLSSALHDSDTEINELQRLVREARAEAKKQLQDSGGLLERSKVQLKEHEETNAKLQLVLRELEGSELRATRLQETLSSREAELESSEEQRKDLEMKTSSELQAVHALLQEARANIELLQQQLVQAYTAEEQAKVELQEGRTADLGRLAQLEMDLKNVSAQAAELEDRLAEGAIREARLLTQVDAAAAEAREALETKKMEGEMNDALSSRLQAEVTQSQAEIEALERQLGTAELQAAATSLYTSFHNTWLVAMSEAFRRWISIPPKEEPRIAFPMESVTNSPRSPPGRASHNPGLSSPQAGVPSLTSHAKDAAIADSSRPEIGKSHTDQRSTTEQAQKHSVGQHWAEYHENRAPISPAKVAIARRTNRILEMQRVVWLSPLGGGACARAIGQWRLAAHAEGKRRLLDETRRIRSERDAAYDRERQLKRGLASLRQERDEIGAALSAAEAAVKRDGESTELAHAKRLVSIVANERDAQAKLAREAKENLAAQQADLDAAAERHKSDKRALASALREKQVLLREVADLRAEKKDISAWELRIQEKEKASRSELERIRLEYERQAQLLEKSSVEKGRLEERHRLRSELEQLQHHRREFTRCEALRRAILLSDARDLHFVGRSLRRWYIAALVSGWAPAVDEAKRLNGADREASKLSKQVSTLSRELKEERTAHQQTLSRLKSERRSIATTKQEKEEHLQKEARLAADLEASRRREDAHRGQTAALKREVAELRQALSASRQQPTLVDDKEAQQDMAYRVAHQRDVALQEVGVLAQELESLQVSLASPALRSPAPQRG